MAISKRLVASMQSERLRLAKKLEKQKLEIEITAEALRYIDARISEVEAVNTTDDKRAA